MHGEYRRLVDASIVDIDRFGKFTKNKTYTTETNCRIKKKGNLLLIEGIGGSVRPYRDVCARDWVEFASFPRVFY